MDALLLVVIALVCAIIVFEINKREQTKIAHFFNGNKLALLIDTDQKRAAIQDLINDESYNEVWRGQLSSSLAQLTHDYDANNITLSDYYHALDQLLGNQYNLSGN